MKTSIINSKINLFNNLISEFVMTLRCRGHSHPSSLFIELRFEFVGSCHVYHFVENYGCHDLAFIFDCCSGFVPNSCSSAWCCASEVRKALCSFRKVWTWCLVIEKRDCLCDEIDKLSFQTYPSSKIKN